jgi:regulator of replication initiation timing
MTVVDAMSVEHYNQHFADINRTVTDLSIENVRLRKENAVLRANYGRVAVEVSRLRDTYHKMREILDADDGMEVRE